MSITVPIVLAAVALGAVFSANASGVPIMTDEGEGEGEGEGEDEGVIDPIDNPNVLAFLRVIRLAESSDNYRSLVGGGNFRSYEGHPYFTEGFQGVPVSGGLRSYAAGAYQITRDTYARLTGRVYRGGIWTVSGNGQFPPNDFSPRVQDRMAIALISGRNALQDIIDGRIESAHAKLRPEWEAFTLPRWDVFRTVAVYNEFGGYSA